jgi:hypothetical protein
MQIQMLWTQLTQIGMNLNQNFISRTQLSPRNIINEIEMTEVPQIKNSSRTFVYPSNIKDFFEKAMIFKRKSPEPSIASSNDENNEQIK